MNDNRNLFARRPLSAAVLFGWQYFVAKPAAGKAAGGASGDGRSPVKQAAAAAAPQTPQAGAGSLAAQQALERTAARIAIDTPTADGSMLLKGAQLRRSATEELSRDHRPQEPGNRAPGARRHQIIPITPYSAGWRRTVPGLKVPDDNTTWTPVSTARLTPGMPVTLQWDNGQGLVFTRTISVDDHYMFQVRDSVATAARRMRALSLTPMSCATACRRQPDSGRCSRRLRRRRRRFAARPRL